MKVIKIEKAFPVNNYENSARGLIISQEAFYALVPWDVTKADAEPGQYNGYLLLVKSYNGNIEKYEISIQDARQIWKELI